MSNNREQSRLRTFISNLMRGATEEEIVSAEESFRAYLSLAERIARRELGKEKTTLDG